MRKASMILGIIGGAIAILIALLVLGGSLFFANAVPALIESEFDSGEYSDYDSVDIEYDESFDILGAVFAGVGGAMLLGGILGLVGGILVPKHNVLAAVLMLIGSVLSLITLYAFLSFLLLLLAGIFALVKDNNAPSKPTFDPNFE